MKKIYLAGADGVGGCMIVRDVDGHVIVVNWAERIAEIDGALLGASLPDGRANDIAHLTCNAMNFAYDEGYKAAQAEIRKSLGINS
jgi:hypothetical protein